MSSKCKWEQQGEFIARKYFPPYLESVWYMDDQSLADLAKGPLGYRRVDNMKLAIKNYLDKYHSDYRWMVKLYNTQDTMKIRDFRGAIFDFLDYQRNQTNILVYGAPMHEYFYG